MADQIRTISRLVAKYLKGEISRPEMQELQEWIDRSDSNRIYFEQMTNPDQQVTDLVLYEKAASVKERAWIKLTELRAQDPKVIRMRVRRWWRTAAAAMILLVCTGMIFWLVRNKERPVSKEGTIARSFKNDLPPGGNKATLTLADGSLITLDNAQKGALGQQGKTRIVKLDSGKIAYDVAKGVANEHSEVLYNVLTTPRAGQFQIVLPDGTKVWLNNASTLRYPTAFTGNERKVELTGEAYFEVTHSFRSSEERGREKIPFIVSTNGMSVRVLGTHFNINAYPDETVIKTTLLEGLVKIVKDKEEALLRPGEQALVNTGILKQSQPAAIRVIKDANTDEAISWKNGIFSFQDADIQSIMRNVSRWYDVDVVYEGKIPERTFMGGISRNSNLSELLKVLELTNIHFELKDGKKLVVKP